MVKVVIPAQTFVIANPRFFRVKQSRNSISFFLDCFTRKKRGFAMTKVCAGMTMFIGTILLMLTLSLIPPANAEALYQFNNPNDANRFNTLTQQIRCIVCQNQNLAESSTPLARDMREKIYQFIKNKKTNQDIEAYLVARYGEFILLKPRFNHTTWFLWIFPFIGLLAVFIFLYRLTRNSFR